MKQITLEELAALERDGAKVTPVSAPEPMPEPVAPPEPPPVAEPAPEPPAPLRDLLPTRSEGERIAGAVREVVAQLREMALLEQERALFASPAEPPPAREYRFTINRDSKGLIESIDAVPVPR